MMNHNLLATIALLSPIVFSVTALIARFQPGIRPLLVKRMAIYSSLISITAAAISGFFVMEHSLLETSLLGFYQVGFSIRLDALSVIMFGMIALLSFIVVRFSQNYLDGDKRQGVFIGNLAATIASVQLLVLSGNLGLLFISWVLTSMSLHKLLVFYHDRPGAIVAARKKFILARIGDVSLFAAFVLLYNQFGTGNLELIFKTIKSSLAIGLPINGIEIVAVLLATAAMLKSAQFPTHGWILEVMETPTPVSALLHAGLLNAGPFLIIRMAGIMEASHIAPIMLIAVGGFTALFASVVFLSQTSVKTALAYSSIAHMGFSLLVSGLGVYSAAMLHLVAHSFYKAHSFLSSGSVIEIVRASKVNSSTRIGSPFRIALGIMMALGLYITFALAWGIDPDKELSLLAIGAVITMGLSRLFTSALDSNGSVLLMVRSVLMAVLVITAFFSLESGMHFLLSSQVPELVRPNYTEIIVMSVLLVAFASVVFIQIIAPKLADSPFYRSIAIHLRNGLYVNTVFDRTVRALYSHETESKAIVIESADKLKKQDWVEVKKLDKQLA